MDQGEIRLGVIGCGGFGLFALQQFAQVPGVTLAGMAGTHREAAHAAAKRFGIPDIEDVDKMLDRDDIDMIYIATPPFLHHPQAMAALRAGKHVICEKPLAMTLAQADEMIAEATKHRSAAGRQPDAAVQPREHRGGAAGAVEDPGRAAARLFRELCLGREPGAEPLVLGPGKERGNLHRTWRAFLRSGCRVAGRGSGRRGPARRAARFVTPHRGTCALHGPV